jgi:hypothetical protein
MARLLNFRDGEEPMGPAFGGPDDKLRDETIHTCLLRRYGLLRGACHRRIRATRWLIRAAIPSAGHPALSDF